ncbi:hypothetical protein BD779DRAFT_1093038 [Infundibulicybe gibba]|nr:hypothetical protein BD779DRAFT_1093038 [Infundibulicybe gibba]
MSDISSREDSSTAPAHQDHGSCVNVSADATGPGETTSPTLKKRKYSEIHDAFGDVVGANGDVASTTSKRLNASRPLMTTTINGTDGALSLEDGNTTPATRQLCGLPIEAQTAILCGVFESSRSINMNPATVTTGQVTTAAFKCPCGSDLCNLQSLILCYLQSVIPILQRSRTAGDWGHPPQLDTQMSPIRRDPDLMPAVSLIAARLKQGGRLIYIGPGAADCLGVLDAAELSVV